MRTTKKRTSGFSPQFRTCLCPYCLTVSPHELRQSFRVWLRWLPLSFLFWLHNRLMHNGNGLRYRDRIKVWRDAQQGSQER